ncbi:hypothetical protein CPLU01_15913 [Colletotrichum plurivorum]|uniref:Carbohydrate-binding module family 18 protein n=1 Tax=Colletotrichum plurivorum TaxID=2175906 RepID=A0A8H6J4Z2_9PEZI|nr:hypothetical protein CPLU01_15913 [Colletotrichum plurivorum]
METQRSWGSLYRIDLEQFMALNPDLDSSCSNIQPKTEYCVRGLFRSTSPSEDGYCGQAHGNATCAGTEMPCCNGLTGKCGSSSNECGLEICDYRFSSGCTAVPQDAASVLDGNACCNSQGNCGSGPEFCGMDVCESGNCTIDIFEMPVIAAARGSLPWLTGTTTDGTCGGEGNRSCDVVFGRCCGPDGFCASDAKACGEGW